MTTRLLSALALSVLLARSHAFPASFGRGFRGLCCHDERRRPPWHLAGCHRKRIGRRHTLSSCACLRPSPTEHGIARILGARIPMFMLFDGALALVEHAAGAEIGLANGAGVGVRRHSADADGDWYDPEVFGSATICPRLRITPISCAPSAEPGHWSRVRQARSTTPCPISRCSNWGNWRWTRMRRSSDRPLARGGSWGGSWGIGGDLSSLRQLQSGWLDTSLPEVARLCHDRVPESRVHAGPSFTIKRNL